MTSLGPRTWDCTTCYCVSSNVRPTTDRVNGSHPCVDAVQLELGTVQVSGSQLARLGPHRHVSLPGQTHTSHSVRLVLCLILKYCATTLCKCLCFVKLYTVRLSHSNTVTQYLLMNVTNAQTLKNGTRSETEVMQN